MYALISDKEKILKNIRIVLASPQVPENIGLCARILKNTSFSHFYLVDPNINSKSFAVAKRARDLLDKAKLFKDIKEAISDSCFVFGTTRRNREHKFIYNFKDTLPLIIAQAKMGPISIVFGKENFGLSKEELDCCDSVFFIPANHEFPSYNLASACGIVCFKIFEYLESIAEISSLELTKKKDIESLFLFIEEALPKLKLKKKMLCSASFSLRRIFSRTHLTNNETQLLKTIFIKINKLLK